MGMVTNVEINLPLLFAFRGALHLCFTSITQQKSHKSKSFLGGPPKQRWSAPRSANNNSLQENMILFFFKGGKKFLDNIFIKLLQKIWK